MLTTVARIKEGGNETVQARGYQRERRQNSSTEKQSMAWREPSIAVLCCDWGEGPSTMTQLISTPNIMHQLHHVCGHCGLS